MIKYSGSMVHAVAENLHMHPFLVVQGLIYSNLPISITYVSIIFIYWVIISNYLHGVYQEGPAWYFN